MKRMIYQAFGLLSGAVMLFTAAGCGKESAGKVRVINDGTVETTAETVMEVDVQTAVIGEEFATDMVTATMDNVYLSAHTFVENDIEVGLLFFQLTVTNNSEEALSLNFLSQSFSIQADGEGYPGISLRGPRFIAQQFGEDAESFSESVQPGETRQGYVCVELPAGFQTAKLMYFPNASLVDWSKGFSFEITREDVQPAPEPVTPY